MLCIKRLEFIRKENKNKKEKQRILEPQALKITKYSEQT